MIANAISWLVFGACAGCVANSVVPLERSQGVGIDLLTGILGALFGGYLSNFVGINVMSSWSFVGFIISIVCTLAFLVMARAISQ